MPGVTHPRSHLGQQRRGSSTPPSEALPLGGGWTIVQGLGVGGLVAQGGGVAGVHAVRVGL